MNTPKHVDGECRYCKEFPWPEGASVQGIALVRAAVRSHVALGYTRTYARLSYLACSSDNGLGLSPDRVRGERCVVDIIESLNRIKQREIDRFEQLRNGRSN